MIFTRCAVAAATLVLATVVSGCGSTDPMPSADLPAGPVKTSGCHVRFESGQPLPDPACTPGVTNPDVTQADIKSTVCESGWTTTIRPAASYTDRLKRQGFTAYGDADTKPGDYEEDHLISLELGGAPSDPGNLWPEPGASPNAKDKVENALNRAVCSGRVTLVTAQHAIATDWTTADKVLGLS